MKPEETIDYPIRLAWNKISRLYNLEASKFGSTMATGFILLNIDQELGSPSTSLGPKLGLEPRSLVRTLAAMEEKGLICRKADAADKRKVRIHLTDLGREKRKISRDTVIRLNHFIRGHIPEERLNLFFGVMQEIVELLEKKEIFETAANTKSTYYKDEKNY